VRMNAENAALLAAGDVTVERDRRVSWEWDVEGLETWAKTAGLTAEVWQCIDVDIIPPQPQRVVQKPHTGKLKALAARLGDRGREMLRCARQEETFGTLRYRTRTVDRETGEILG